MSRLPLLFIVVTGFIGGSVGAWATVFNWPVELGCGLCTLTGFCGLIFELSISNGWGSAFSRLFVIRIDYSYGLKFDQNFHQRSGKGIRTAPALSKFLDFFSGSRA